MSLDSIFIILIFTLLLVVLIIGGLNLKEAKIIDKISKNDMSLADFKKLVSDKDVPDSEIWNCFWTDTGYLKPDCHEFLEVLRKKRPELFSKILSCSQEVI